MTSDDLEKDGFSLVRGVLTLAEVIEWRGRLGPVDGAGRRGLLDVPEVAEWARSPEILALVRPHLRGEPRPVRGIYFDKSAEANWLVPWHQDLTIAVRERVESAGFGPWSVKDAVPHVQPPMEFLEQIVTVRVHLDDADEENGALRVLPGSHRLGRLGSERISELRAEISERVCAVAEGDALLMRPLLLHASGRSTSGRHRRVIHVEYAGFELPAGMAWAEGGTPE